MTNEELNNIYKYAKACYFRDNIEFANKSDLQDYVQDFALLALEHPADSLAFIASRMRYKNKIDSPEQFDVLHALPISSTIDEDGEPYSFFTPFLTYWQEYFADDKQEFLQAVAVSLFPNKPERQAFFMDFCAGVVGLPSNKVGDLRDIIFNNRFKVLDLMYEYGYLSLYWYEHYKALAESLTKRPKIPYRHSNATHCVVSRACAQRKRLQNATLTVV